MLLDGFLEYYFLKDVVIVVGFLLFNNLEYLFCGVIGFNGECSF